MMCARETSMSMIVYGAEVFFCFIVWMWSYNFRIASYEFFLK